MWALILPLLRINVVGMTSINLGKHRTLARPNSHVGVNLQVTYMYRKPLNDIEGQWRIQGKHGAMAPL